MREIARVVCGVRGRGRTRVWWVGGAVEEEVGGDVVVLAGLGVGEDGRGRGIAGMVRRWMRLGCYSRGLRGMVDSCASVLSASIPRTLSKKQQVSIRLAFGHKTDSEIHSNDHRENNLYS